MIICPLKNASDAVFQELELTLVHLEIPITVTSGAICDLHRPEVIPGELMGQ